MHQQLYSYWCDNFSLWHGSVWHQLEKLVKNGSKKRESVCDILVTYLDGKRRLNEEQCARWKQLKQQFWKMFVKLINGAYSTFFKSWEEKGQLNYKDTTCI